MREDFQHHVPGLGLLSLLFQLPGIWITGVHYHTQLERVNFVKVIIALSWTEFSLSEPLKNAWGWE